MRKVIIISFILLGSFFTQAQINPHAIGLRFGGDGDINGAEISYQHKMSEINRLEFDLGFRGNSDYSRTSLTGIYQWVWNIQEGFNWYAGPGATLGFFSDDDDDDDDDDEDSYMNIGIGGQIGIEYDFNQMNAPILVSLDLRPLFDFLGDDPGIGWGACLSVRYTW